MKKTLSTVLGAIVVWLHFGSLVVTTLSAFALLKVATPGALKGMPSIFTSTSLPFDVTTLTLCVLSLRIEAQPVTAITVSIKVALRI